MNPAPLKIASRAEFERMDIEDFPFAISIREYDATEFARPGYAGGRLTLSFWDLTGGPGIATVEDIDAVYDFSKAWASAAHADTRNGLVVHCFAGISRSSAVSLVPLILYYQNVKLAAKRLFEVNRRAIPNTHVMNLIDDKFHLKGDLFRAVYDAERGMIWQ